VSRETLQLAAPAADYTQEDGAQGSDTESDSESHEDDHEDAHLMYDLKTIQTALEPINKLHRKWLLSLFNLAQQLLCSLHILVKLQSRFNYPSLAFPHVFMRLGDKFGLCLRVHFNRHGL